jgi:hypothetical protein
MPSRASTLPERTPTALGWAGMPAAADAAPPVISFMASAAWAPTITSKRVPPWSGTVNCAVARFSPSTVVLAAKVLPAGMSLKIARPSSPVLRVADFCLPSLVVHDPTTFTPATGSVMDGWVMRTETVPTGRSSTKSGALVAAL